MFLHELRLIYAGRRWIPSPTFVQRIGRHSAAPNFISPAIVKHLALLLRKHEHTPGVELECHNQPFVPAAVKNSRILWNLVEADLAKEVKITKDLSCRAERRRMYSLVG